MKTRAINYFVEQNQGRRNEHGNVSIVTLLSVGVVAAFTYLVPLYFPFMDEILYRSLLAIVVLAAIASVGCALHLKFLGDRSPRRLVAEVEGQIRFYDDAIFSADEKIKRIEQRILSNPGALSRRGMDCLGLLKRITRAVYRRNVEAKRLARSGKSLELYEAYDILNTSLEVDDNAVDALIDTDPVPPLENIEIRPAIEKLISELESEVRKAA